MAHAEFVEWQAFLAVEPSANLRADIHTAMLMGLLANIYRDPKKRSEPFVLDDFLPDWWGERSEDGPPAAELLRKFRMISDAINARENDG